MGTAGIMRLLALFGLVGVFAGCAAVPPPVVMDSHFQRRTITLCDDDRFCFRRSYEVAWDARCVPQAEEDGTMVCSREGKAVQVRAEFPISYRSEEQVVETGAGGYLVTLPAAGTVKTGR